jgi:excisionase family DNA binding protein
MKTKYLTRKATAERLAVSDRSIDRWIKANRIQAVKVGRAVRIAEASVDKLIADCTV